MKKKNASKTICIPAPYTKYKDTSFVLDDIDVSHIKKKAAVILPND